MERYEGNSSHNIRAHLTGARSMVINRQLTETLALASGEYDLRKDEARKAGCPTRVTIPMIEREFKLRPKTLTCYRANHYSRKR